MLHNNKHNNKMNNKITNIDQILNDPLFVEMMEQEEKQLKECGWTYEEIKSVANMVTGK